MRNLFFVIIAVFGLSSCGTNLLDGFLTENRMVEALKEALYLGSETAASNLGNSSCKTKTCTTGYLGREGLEIPLPPNIQNIFKNINAVSHLIGGNFGDLGDSIRIAMNRGAEKAAPKSIEIFKDAILGMSISNAKGILTGDDTAATSYLKVSTYSDLLYAFGPIIKVPLDSLNLNKFWEPIASHYNEAASNALISPALPYSSLPKDISADLADWATGKALDGLFKMVGKQEAKLRADPWGTVSAEGLAGSSKGDLLGDVFSKAKNGSL